MNISGKILALIIAICLIIGGFIGYSLKPCKYIPGGSTHSSDTSIVVTPVKPDSSSGTGNVVFHKPVIHKSKETNDSLQIPLDSSNGLKLYVNIFNGKTVEPDSINIEMIPYYILSFPFTSTFRDTTKRDTIESIYEFPHDIHTVLLRSVPDTTIIIHDSTTIYVEKAPAWTDQTWFKIVTYSATAVGFFYLGNKLK